MWLSQVERQALNLLVEGSNPFMPAFLPFFAGVVKTVKSKLRLGQINDAGLKISANRVARWHIPSRRRSGVRIPPPALFFLKIVENLELGSPV